MLQHLLILFHLFVEQAFLSVACQKTVAQKNTNKPHKTQRKHRGLKSYHAEHNFGWQVNCFVLFVLFDLKMKSGSNDVFFIASNIIGQQLWPHFMNHWSENQYNELGWWVSPHSGTSNYRTDHTPAEITTTQPKPKHQCNWSTHTHVLVPPRWQTIMTQQYNHQRACILQWVNSQQQVRGVTH